MMKFMNMYKVFLETVVFLTMNKVNYRIIKSLTEGAVIVNKRNLTVPMKAVKNAVELANIRNAHVKDGIACTKFMYWLKSNVGKMPIDEMSGADSGKTFAGNRKVLLI